MESGGFWRISLSTVLSTSELLNDGARWRLRFIPLVTVSSPAPVAGATYRTKCPPRRRAADRATGLIPRCAGNPVVSDWHYRPAGPAFKFRSGTLAPTIYHCPARFNGQMSPTMLDLGATVVFFLAVRRSAMRDRLRLGGSRVRPLRGSSVRNGAAIGELVP